MNETIIEDALKRYDQQRHDLQIFMEGVVNYIGRHPELNLNGHQVVHSFKSRLKDREHLRQKILRKSAQGTEINSENLFSKITDLAGVRILHLFQEHFESIDSVIRQKVLEEGDWWFAEQPKAYTWDPKQFHFLSSSISKCPKSPPHIRASIILSVRVKIRCCAAKFR